MGQGQKLAAAALCVGAALGLSAAAGVLTGAIAPSPPEQSEVAASLAALPAAAPADVAKPNAKPPAARAVAARVWRGDDDDGEDDD